MRWQFDEIDAHGQTMGTIINDMESSLQGLKKLQAELDPIFRGKGGEAYQETSVAFSQRLANYSAALGQAKLAIGQAAYLMQVTDGQNGQLFYST